MKIDKASLPLPATKAGDTSARPAKPSDGSASAPKAEGTSVHLGTASAQLRSMESAAASAPAVDANKIAEIKQAISEGRFQVNSGVVADKLIATVRDLISAGSR